MKLPRYEDFKLRETYIYYDQPVFYTCVDSENRLYLVNHCDETETEETLLFAPVTEKQIQALERGEIELRTPFLEPEGGMLIRAVLPFWGLGPPRLEWIQIDAVDDDLLPLQGERFEK